MKNTILKRLLSAKLMVMIMVFFLFSSTVWAATAISSAMGSVTASKFAGTGTTADPYRIITTGTASGTGAFTAPSQFWGDSSQPNGVGTFAVTFEQFTGNTTEGELISSYNFDLGQNATSVWDGTWTYAFRFPAWTVFDTSTGDLRMAFPYKGNFDTFWEDWSYKFDVVSLTSGLSQAKQIQPGDTVKITYYGNYISSQTSRGTNYATNFSITDQNASATYYATVDGTGYATFSGANAIEYGGNYSVEKVQ
ncbi:hypothetical protein G5B47_16075 [Paenibacillus sp. 7124]|uniref:Uncharacterized protein n=1 Tax=Paenibacillus apii TaxID=1850370 RepID=A0A6M1PK16_9BACL|nr:hypothetical protein [Paenibacillus apii]NGM83937.1 hypothetical protein [Paenibacillus apii]